MAQLTMIFPPDLLRGQTQPITPDGFVLRCFRPGDEAGYLAIMQNAGFRWTHDHVKTVLQSALPDGIFFIEDNANHKFAATAMANREAPPGMDSGGELGWVAVSQAYRGHGFGKIVCQAVMNRYRKAQYTHVYLRTHDHLLPALRIYLQTGWRPLMIDETMPERWKHVEEKPQLPCIPFKRVPVPEAKAATLCAGGNGSGR